MKRVRSKGSRSSGQPSRLQREMDKIFERVNAKIEPLFTSTPDPGSFRRRFEAKKREEIEKLKASLRKNLNFNKESDTGGNILCVVGFINFI